MREYKFRGKRKDNGEWVYGYIFNPNAPLCDSNWGTWIIQEDFFDVLTWLRGSLASVKVHAYEVDPATVGQYTGLHDKNGKEIYEGDIVNRRGGEYWQGCYEFDDTITISDLMDIVTTAEFESLLVISSIHDNPELLATNKPSE